MQAEVLGLLETGLSANESSTHLNPQMKETDSTKTDWADPVI